MSQQIKLTFIKHPLVENIECIRNSLSVIEQATPFATLIHEQTINISYNTCDFYIIHSFSFFPQRELISDAEHQKNIYWEILQIARYFAWYVFCLDDRLVQDFVHFCREKKVPVRENRIIHLERTSCKRTTPFRLGYVLVPPSISHIFMPSSTHRRPIERAFSDLRPAIGTIERRE